QQQDASDLLFQPLKISSILDYETHFGQPYPEKTIQVTIDTAGGNITVAAKVAKPSKYGMYYSLQLFFANGGGACYIVSTGNYSSRGSITGSRLRKGLKAAGKIRDATLTIFPDGLAMRAHRDYYTLHKEAMEQAARLGDRFVVMDIWVKPADSQFNPVQTFHDFDFGGTEIVQYGAAYYPRIATSLDYFYEPSGRKVAVTCKVERSLSGTLEALGEKDAAVFVRAKKAIADIPMLLPASPAVVGRYADVDRTRGVWKAAANVEIEYALATERLITQQEQEDLNVDAVTGKSVNVIRSFTGRGPAIIWGARTLAGNDNEWRYIPVRRYFIMVEGSVKQATTQFHFEPNDASTWIRIKAMIENYLVQQWRAGALQGTTPRDAFYVRVGLGETMTQQDLLEGQLIVEIGLAVVRPAEFIILKFMHQMRTEA
ncbi:MAG TPA: phage tail sheath C-terminal domain-containing protein, partial [Flavisolibacter sp.]